MERESRAALSGANLRVAMLSVANLRNAYLSVADLSGARHDEQTDWPDGFTPPPSR